MLSGQGNPRTGGKLRPELVSPRASRPEQGIYSGNPQGFLPFILNAFVKASGLEPGDLVLVQVVVHALLFQQPCSHGYPLPTMFSAR